MISGVAATQVVALIIWLALTIAVARVLGPTGNGIVATAILIPTVMTAVWNLGIAPANAYFIAKGDVESPVAYRATLIQSSLISLVGCLTVVLPFYFFAERLFPDVPMPMIWGVLLVFPISSAQTALASIFLGVQNFRPYNFASLAAPVVNAIGVAVLLFWLKWGPGGAVIAYGLGQFAGLIVTLILLKPYIGGKTSFAEVLAYIKQSIRYGFSINLGNVFSYISYRVDMILVAVILGSTAVGIYSIAIQIAERAWLLSFTVSSVLLPKLSELDKSEDSRKELTPIVARWVLAATIVLSIGVILVGKPVTIFLFGMKYVQSFALLIWLLPGITSCALSRILANDIASRGRIDVNLRISIFVCFANIAANLALIPTLGMVGSALASSIGYFADTIVRIVSYSKLSGNPWWSTFTPQVSDVHLFKAAYGQFRLRMARR